MASLQILYNQSIFDLANENGYTIDYVIKLIQENPFITSINYDLNANPNQSITYDETFKSSNPQILTQKVSTSNYTKTIQGLADQTTLDIAIETVGLDNLISFLKSNNISNINTQDVNTKLFTFNVADIKDLGFYNNLNINRLRITTGTTITNPIPTIFYLLKEDGFYLLQENGFKIIL